MEVKRWGLTTRSFVKHERKMVCDEKILYFFRCDDEQVLFSVLFFVTEDECTVLKYLVFVNRIALVDFPCMHPCMLERLQLVIAIVIFHRHVVGRVNTDVNIIRRLSHSIHVVLPHLSVLEINHLE